MFLFTSIEISSQSKQRYECRCFVIFRTNFKIRHGRSLAYVPSFISIYYFPDKNVFSRKNRAKTGRNDMAMFFLFSALNR